MIYTYDTQLPFDNVALNRKAWYKLPRSILLPPYLAINPYFTDFADAIDEVFDYVIEARIDAFRQLRNMWVTTKSAEEKIALGQMLDFTDWGGPERAIVVQQVNLLGLKLSNAGVVSEGSYRAIAKFLGSYWFGKGKGAAIDFLNFCLGGGLTITRLVTQDYVNFFPPSSAQVGAYIYDTPPGPWYPTTHVQITMPSTYGVSPITLGSFFYEICNYNLVLQSISVVFNLLITSSDSPDTAVIVAVGAIGNYQFLADTPHYPILYHSTAGGWTGGMGQKLTQISDVIWTP